MSSKTEGEKKVDSPKENEEAKLGSGTQAEVKGSRGAGSSRAKNSQDEKQSETITPKSTSSESPPESGKGDGGWKTVRRGKPGGDERHKDRDKDNWGRKHHGEKSGGGKPANVKVYSKEELLSLHSPKLPYPEDTLKIEGVYVEEPMPPSSTDPLTAEEQKLKRMLGYQSTRGGRGRGRGRGRFGYPQGGGRGTGDERMDKNGYQHPGGDYEEEEPKTERPKQQVDREGGSVDIGKVEIIGHVKNKNQLKGRNDIIDTSDTDTPHAVLPTDPGYDYKESSFEVPMGKEIRQVARDPKEVESEPKAQKQQAKEEEVHDSPPLSGDYSLNTSSQSFDDIVDSEAMQWLYRDKNGNMQGPFPRWQMREWYSKKYLSPSLLVSSHSPGPRKVERTFAQIREVFDITQPFFKLPDENEIGVEASIPEKQKQTKDSRAATSLENTDRARPKEIAPSVQSFFSAATGASTSNREVKEGKSIISAEDLERQQEESHSHEKVKTENASEKQREEGEQTVPIQRFFFQAAGKGEEAKQRQPTALPLKVPLKEPLEEPLGANRPAEVTAEQNMYMRQKSNEQVKAEREPSTATGGNVKPVVILNQMWHPQQVAQGYFPIGQQQYVAPTFVHAVDPRVPYRAGVAHHPRNPILAPAPWAGVVQERAHQHTDFRKIVEDQRTESSALAAQKEQESEKEVDRKGEEVDKERESPVEEPDSPKSSGSVGEEDEEVGEELDYADYEEDKMLRGRRAHAHSTHVKGPLHNRPAGILSTQKQHSITTMGNSLEFGLETPEQLLGEGRRQDVQKQRIQAQPSQQRWIEAKKERKEKTEEGEEVKEKDKEKDKDMHSLTLPVAVKGSPRYSPEAQELRQSQPEKTVVVEESRGDKEREKAVKMEKMKTQHKSKKEKEVSRVRARDFKSNESETAGWNFSKGGKGKKAASIKEIQESEVKLQEIEIEMAKDAASASAEPVASDPSQSAWNVRAAKESSPRAPSLLSIQKEEEEKKRLETLLKKPAQVDVERIFSGNEWSLPKPHVSYSRTLTRSSDMTNYEEAKPRSPGFWDSPHVSARNASAQAQNTGAPLPKLDDGDFPSLSTTLKKQPQPSQQVAAQNTKSREEVVGTLAKAQAVVEQKGRERAKEAARNDFVEWAYMALYRLTGIEDRVFVEKLCGGRNEKEDEALIDEHFKQTPLLISSSKRFKEEFQKERRKRGSVTRGSSNHRHDAPPRQGTQGKRKKGRKQKDGRNDQFLDIFDDLLFHLEAATTSKDNAVRDASSSFLMESASRDGSKWVALAEILLGNVTEKHIRQAAGIVLKRFILEHWSEDEQILSNEQRAHLKQMLPGGVLSEDECIRSAAGMCVAEIAKSDWPEHWEGLLETVVEWILNAGEKRKAQYVLQFLSFWSPHFSTEVLEGLTRSLAPVVISVLEASNGHTRQAKIFALMVARDIITLLTTTECESVEEFFMNEFLPEFLRLLFVSMIAPDRPDEDCGVQIWAMSNVVSVLRGFPHVVHANRDAFIQSVLAILGNSYSFYEDAFISGRIHVMDVFDSDRNLTRLDVMIDSCVELLLALSEAPIDVNMLEEYVEAILPLVVPFVQLCEGQVLNWLEDPNEFVRDEWEGGIDRVDVRSTCTALFTEIAAETENGIELCISVFSSFLEASHVHRGRGVEHWWKQLEAGLLGLQSIAEAVVEVYQQISKSPSHSTLTQHQTPQISKIPEIFEKFVLPELELMSSSIKSREGIEKHNPFLVARILRFSGSFADSFGDEFAHHIVSVSGLLAGMENAPIFVQLAAAATCEKGCRSLAKQGAQGIESALDETIDALIALSAKMSEDSLTFVLETLQLALSINEEVSLKHEAGVTNAMLHTWVANAVDPVIIIDVVDVLNLLSEQCASSVELSHAFASHVLQTVDSVMQAWLNDPNAPCTGNEENALSILHSVVKFHQRPMYAPLRDVLFPRCLEIVAKSDDPEVLQEASLVLNSFIGSFHDELLIFDLGNGMNGIDAVLQAIEKLVSTGDDRSSLHCGKLLLKLMIKLPRYLKDVIGNILSVLLKKMEENSPVVKNFVLAFAYLARTDVSSLIDFFIDRAVRDRNAFEALMDMWLHEHSRLFGAYAIKMSVSGLANVFKADIPRLLDMHVHDEEKEDENQLVPLKMMILRVLALEMVDDNETAAQASVFLEQDLMNLMLYQASGMNITTRFPRMNDIFKEDDGVSMEEDEDPDILNDPLYKAELLPFLRDFFEKIIERNGEKFFEYLGHFNEDELVNIVNQFPALQSKLGIQ